MPLRVGKYEPGASKSDKAALMAAISSLGSDAAGIISKSTEIEFVESQKQTGGGQSIYEVLARFCDAQMSKAILGQTLTSEAGGDKGQGSFALGQVHNDVRQDLVEADCKALGKTMTQQIIRPLVGFNFGWDAPVPTFRLLYEAPEDLASAANVYKTLSDMGQPISQEHISERFKVPLPAAGETPLSRPQSVPGGFFAKAVAPRAVTAKMARTNTAAIAGQVSLDASVSRVLPLAANEMELMLQPVIARIEQAQSLEEIGQMLYTLYSDLDGQAFQQLLARAMFSSALIGATAVEGK